MSYEVCVGDANLNYTRNGALLWYKFLDHDDGLRSLDELTGSQAAGKLADFFERIHREDTVELDRKYSPSNGWGSLTDQLIFAARVMATCNVHPSDLVSVYA